MEQTVRRELVEAAQRGDHEAFEVLAADAVDRLYAVARLILRDTHLAEDAVQEALVRAWRDLPGLRDPDRLDAWLRRLVVNACADQGRQVRRHQARVRLVRAEPTTDDAGRALADRDEVERGFRQLKREQREVLVLHHYLGLSTADIADTLAVPIGTVKSRLHYATEAMRAALDADQRRAAITNGRTA